MFRNRLVLIVAIAVPLGLASYTATNYFKRLARESEMNQMRLLVAEISNAQDNATRGNAALFCMAHCEKLVAMQPPIGPTAALFAIGAAPVAGKATEVELPAVETVKTLDTDDLLKATNLIFHSRQFKLADQMIELLLLRREDPRRDEILRLAIEIRFEVGRDRDVLIHCDELLARKPDSAYVYRVQMMVHRNHGRWDNFIPAAEKALTLATETDYVLLVEAADAYTRVGRTDEARKIIDQINKNQPDLMKQAPTVYARLLIQEGKTDQAKEIIKTFLTKSADDTEALLIQSSLLVAEAEFEKAIQVLQRVIEIDPSEQEAYYQLGQAYARTGDSDSAKKFLEKHKTLLDARVQLYQLEQQAAAEPRNMDVRRKLAASYAEIGLEELSQFWQRTILEPPRN